MNPPSRTTAAAGAAGGLAHVLVVGALLSYFDYHVFRTPVETVLLVPGVFVLGALPVALSAHTRLVAPGGGFLVLVASVVSVEVTSPPPQNVGELGEYAIVDGSFYLVEYADSWYVWLSLLLVAGVAELAIRRGYALGDDRLRHLPDPQLARSEMWTVVAACSAVVATATMLLLIADSLWHTVPGYAIAFVIVAAATAVPFAALLSRGLVSPLVSYGLVITHTIRVHVFMDPDGLGMVFLGATSVVYALVAVLEWLVRSRLLGWDGGRFVDGARLGQ